MFTFKHESIRYCYAGNFFSKQAMNIKIFSLYANNVSYFSTFEAFINMKREILIHICMCDLSN